VGQWSPSPSFYRSRYGYRNQTEDRAGSANWAIDLAELATAYYQTTTRFPQKGLVFKPYLIRLLATSSWDSRAENPVTTISGAPW